MKDHSIKILICDDSILIIKQLKDVLISWGYFDVIEALDGQDAVNKYKKNLPDIVFMDIVIPIKGGIDAVDEILDFDKNAKIVMVSASGTKSNLKKALQAGAFDFIQKPLKEMQIMNILNNLEKEI